MSLACQKNSYLKEFDTKVRSCVVSSLNTVLNGKKQKVQGYDVILEDTILFPEGGGQPDDRGTINDAEVLRVTRRGADAVHFVSTPLEPGTPVSVRVDWTRRWEHMQQHSGQHLITAIADEKFGFPTTSWYLGEKISSIELDTPSMSRDQQDEIEAIVNEKIRASVAMFPTLYESIDDPKLKEVRTRGLPDDHVGAVRVVTIEGIECNMCCGTHVSNLAHLQAIKLLGVEKKKGRVNLLFVAGERVLKYLGTYHEREKVMTSYLKGNPDEHPALVEKLQRCFKETKKNETTLLRDVAKLEADLYKANPQKPRLFSLHRKEGDIEFMNMLINEINDPEACIFLTTGDDKGQGMFMVVAPDHLLSSMAPKVMEVIEGKGFCKQGRCQGKANRLGKRAAAEAIIQQHLSTTQQAPNGES